MSSHHDNHSSTEKKPVAFTVPLILGLVAVAIIVALVSIGDPCHCNKECAEGRCSKECMEACEHGDHSKHPEAAAAGHEEAGGHGAEMKDDPTLPVVDTADDKEAAPTPEHNPAEHGH
jgi:hypothetical protein